MTVKASDVKALRERTGAGLMNCKRALAECQGGIDDAIHYLRKKGLAAAAKKQGRVAAEGLIGSYVHDGRIGVMVEVNCETDFVAKNAQFQEFVKDVALHIAAADPKFIREGEMDQAFIDHETEIATFQLKDQGKPEHMIPKILQGKIKKLASEICLLNQKFVKDPDHTINDLVNDLTLKLGEKVTVRRFARFNLGEGIEKKKQENLTVEVAKLKSPK